MAGPVFDPSTVDTSVLDRYSKLVTGNPNLNSAPGLVEALATGNATRQQAQALDQWMGGLKAAQRVTNATQSGVKINLSPYEKQALDLQGIGYGDVEYTDRDRNAGIIDAAEKAGLVVERDSRGNFVNALTVEQQRQKDEAAADAAVKKALSGGDGGWKNPITSLKAGGGKVLSGMNKGWNYVSGSISEGVEGFVNNLKDLTIAARTKSAPAANFTTAANDQDAQDAIRSGYDPNNPWSMMAYRASGKAYNSTLDLEQQFGGSQVAAAKDYLTDPQGFLDRVMADNPAPQAAELLKQINDPGFIDVVRRVASRHEGIGTLVTTNIGIDPVDHPRAYALTAAGVELAAAFALDPNNAVFAGYKGVKAAQIGLNGVDDAAMVYKIYDPLNNAFKAKQVRRGTEFFLEDTKIIREAGEGSVDAAAAFARIQARTPGFVNLIPDVTGARRLDDTVTTARRGELPEVFNVKPIETMDEFADYLASKSGLMRLSTGQAVVEGSLMPGAISAVGYRRIRAALADGSTRRAFAITERNAAKFLPSADDAVDAASGAVIAAVANSADEAAKLRAAAASGEAAYQGSKSLQQRWLRTGTRLVAFTPRDTVFRLTGSTNEITKINRYARMYLSKYDANALSASFARADEGTRLSILRGLELQTLHAAGAGHTTAGRELIKKLAEARSGQRYGSGMTDDMLPDATGMMQHYALHPSELRTPFTLPNFRELRLVMAKTTVSSATTGRVMEHVIVDKIMSAIKAGWLTTGTNVTRNVGEAWANLTVRGEFRSSAAAKAIANENGGLIPHIKPIQRLIDMPYSGLTPLGKMVRAMAKIGGDERELYHIARKAGRDGGAAQHQFSLEHGAALRNPVDDADVLTQGGFKVGVMHMKYEGMSEETAAGALGADRWSARMEHMLGGGEDAELVRRTLAVIRGGDIDDVTKYIADNNVFRGSRQESLYVDADGAFQPVITAADRELAQQRIARQLVNDWRLILTGTDGKASERVMDEITRTGHAPNGEWLQENIPTFQRPPMVLAPNLVPVAEGGAAGLAGKIADITGGAYQVLVQNVIDRMSTSPIFYAQYGKLRKSADVLEARLVANGWSPEAADNMLDNWATQSAWQKTFQRTDNPELKTQLDITGRNFFAFSRATQDFVRRWSGTFVEDPGRLRRIQLTLDAAVSGGVVWEDPATGQKNFTFPGTGPLIDGLLHLGKTLHLPFVPEVPTSTSLSGRVVFLQPGLNNPAQMSLTPIINWPMRKVMQALPDSDGMWNELRIQMQHADMLLNGEQGYGKDLTSQVLPGAFKKMMDANNDDRDGMLTSAMKEALAALMAAGKVPDGMDDNEKQHFLDNVKIQTRNQLMLRAAFGLFAPASPNVNQKGFDEDVDPAYQMLGVQTLHDEFKLILNQAKGDKGKAVAIWTELHPDKLVYTIAGSEGTTKGAYLPATADTNAWMESNINWMKDYRNVSAYFIPPAVSSDFDMTAWRTQMQLGLRQNKTLEEFYTDAATINSESQYYEQYNIYQEDLADAQLRGATQTVKDVKAMWSDWKAGFYELNPLFKEKQGSYGQSVVNAQHQIESLRNIAAGGSGPATVTAAIPGLQLMLNAYDEHKAFADANSGGSNKATADRAAEKARYAAYVAGVAGQSPALTAIYNGVFRYLDKDLERISG